MGDIQTSNGAFETGMVRRALNPFASDIRPGIIPECGGHTPWVGDGQDLIPTTRAKVKVLPARCRKDGPPYDSPFSGTLLPRQRFTLVSGFLIGSSVGLSESVGGKDISFRMTGAFEHTSETFTIIPLPPFLCLSRIFAGKNDHGWRQR